MFVPACCAAYVLPALSKPLLAVASPAVLFFSSRAFPATSSSPRCGEFPSACSAAGAVLERAACGGAAADPAAVDCEALNALWAKEGVRTVGMID